jgi:hypothetical protein
MATGTVVHEIPRATLQRGDVADVVPGTFHFHVGGAPGATRDENGCQGRDG